VETPKNYCPSLVEAINHVPDAVFAIDIAGKVTLWNPAAVQLTGLTREAVLNHGYEVYALGFYPAPRPLLLNYLLRQEDPPLGTYLWLRREQTSIIAEQFAPRVNNGAGAHLWARASLLFDDAGAVIGATQVMIDVSESRKQQRALQALTEEMTVSTIELTSANERLLAAEVALRQQYDELKRTTNLLETAHGLMWAVIEHLPDAAFVIDRDKKVIAWNKAMERYSGVPKEQVMGTGNYAAAIYQPPSPLLIDFVGRPEEEARAHYGEFFRKSENGVLHTEGVQPNVYGGRDAYVAVLAAPLLDTAGNMVGAIESIHDLTLMREKDADLRASEELLREVTNHMSDLLCKVSRTGIVEYVSPSFLAVAGLSPHDIIGHHYSKSIHPEDVPLLVQAGREFYSSDSLSSGRVEFRARNVQGIYRSLDGQGSVIRDSGGEVTGSVYVLRDVTEQKAFEERLDFLRHRDNLTGCYNRSFFEEQLDGYCKAANFPLTIIVLDLDGLKAINTNQGHHQGDMLLQAMVSVVGKCLAPTHFLARVGGDELAIILPNSTEEEVHKICAAIETRVTAYNLQFPALPLSISMGYASSDSITPLKALFERADTIMNRKKLTHRQSSRSSLVQTMMKALESRDYITEGHADRLQDLVTSLAEGLNLCPSTITELRLLAQFHDIGKIGVPDRVLFKPDKLTPDEIKEMRLHSEIGARIAQASPDLAPIADWILKHHEWYNGEGYPLKLRGEEIPIECRILCIADAYDAMTNNRPYRRAMSHESAVLELRRGAGEQFDPQLVPLFIALLEQGMGTYLAEQ